MEKMKLQIQKFAITVTTTFQESNTNIEANTSTLKVNIYFSPNNTQTWFQSATLYCWVDGAEQSQKVGLSKGGSVSASFTYNNIQHNNDGTKTVNWEWYIKTGTSVLGTLNPTGTRTLTTIPRASQPTIDNTTPELGQQITITTNRASNTFTHTLRYQFGNATGTIATDVTETATWTPAITLAQQIPNAESGIGTIYCDTYSGTTLIGTKSVKFTASVPANITPSISLSNPIIGGSAPASWGIFVKGKSTASYTITGTGNQGSTISQYQSSVAGYRYTTANVTTGILYSAGTQTISAKVIDSRGRQATTSKTFNVVDYYNPSFTAVQIQRVDQNGNLDDNGEYAFFNFAGSVSSCSGNNKGTFKIAYRVKNTGSYTEKTIATNAQSINQSGFITSDGTQSGTKIEFENTNTYDIKFMITDAFIAVENKQELDTGFDLINWNPSGKALAIGKVSEAGANERKLEIAMDTQIEGQMEATGSLITTGNDTGVICDNQNAQTPRKTKYTVSNTGMAGIYDMTNSNWVVLSETNQNVSIPHQTSIGGALNMGGDINTQGHDLSLNTTGSSSNNSGDIIWKYGNGNEKARIWTDDTQTSSSKELNYRSNDANGNNLVTTKLATLENLHEYNVLWGPDYYFMTAVNTINLSQKVSEQKTGIVLVWQAYSDNAPQPWDYNFTFIPKWQTITNSSRGVVCYLATSHAGYIGTKYVYVFDNKIKGHNDNSTGATKGNSGITTTNNHWVLTYVIGV